MPYIYLASPYTHPDPSVQRQRYHDVTLAVAQLVDAGHIVYSPIAHFHPIAELHSLPGDYTFWSRINTAMLRGAQALHVLQLDGWKHSKGVQAEIDLALRLELPIRYYNKENIPT